MNFFKKLFSSDKKETLDKGLEKSKTSFFDKLTRAIAGKSKVDDGRSNQRCSCVVIRVESLKNLITDK